MSDKNPESSNDVARSYPNCGKCRNHGIIVLLRGHKQNCQFRDCECECCILGVQRRVVMAAQNAHRKQRKVEEKGECRVTPTQSMDDLREIPPPAPSSPSNPEAAAQPSGSSVGADLEEHSYSANELIKMFGLEMNALPFVYGILGVAGDMQTAIAMVNEASNELRVNSPDKNYHAGPSAFQRSSADNRHQAGVLSLVKPRFEPYSKESTFRRDPPSV